MMQLRSPARSLYSEATFAQKLTFGQSGENGIARWLVSNLGWTVLPVYEKEGGDFKGPRCFAPGREIVAPDILAIKGDRVMWVEAKHKTVFSWHRISQQWVTGIDIRHYHDYLELSRRHPFPVWLLFLHEREDTDEGDGHSPTGLFGQSLDYLVSHENHRSDRWGRTGMVYWAHSTLRRMAALDTDGARVRLTAVGDPELSDDEVNEGFDDAIDAEFPGRHMAGQAQYTKEQADL